MLTVSYDYASARVNESSAVSAKAKLPAAGNLSANWKFLFDESSDVDAAQFFTIDMES